MQKVAANRGGRAIRGAWVGLFVCLFWDCGDCWMCVLNVQIWICMRSESEIWIWDMRSECEFWIWDLSYEIWIWDLNLRSESERANLRGALRGEPWWVCLYVCYEICGGVYERANMNLRSEIWIWIWDLNLNAQISRGERPAEPARVCLFVCLFVWLFWDCWMCCLNVQIGIWDLRSESESEIWIWDLNLNVQIWGARLSHGPWAGKKGEQMCKSESEFERLKNKPTNNHTH
jgi:hypothetical protein